MNKISFIIASSFVFSMAFAGENKKDLEHCKNILSGENGTLLRNEIKKNKKDFFSSNLVKSVCPEIQKISDEESKLQAGMKIVAGYSLIETNCKETHWQQLSVPLSNSLRHSDYTLRLGGIYWLPLSQKWREKNLKNTPCDYIENTIANQTPCVVYLFSHPNKSTELFSPFNTAPRWDKKVFNRFQKVITSEIPACNTSETGNVKTETTPKGKTKQVIK